MMDTLKKYECGEPFFGCWFDHLKKQTKFLQEFNTPPQPPVWYTKNVIIFENDQFILRDFSISWAPNTRPVLILPPQAGHHSSICDYDKGKSIVEAALKAGHTEVFAIEWKTATQARKDEDIASFIRATDLAIKRTYREKVNLIGLCQGGWQAAIYAALHPAKVNTLTLAGAPIDFKADGGHIQMLVDSLPHSFYENLVAQGDGLMCGKIMLDGWKNMNFTDRYWWDYCDLWNNIEDDAFIARYHKFRDWYEYTQDLPGEFYLEVVSKLFRCNQLIKGELEIDGRRVGLAKIECPLHMIAGNEKDDITLTNQLLNAADYVSSKEVYSAVVDAGHIGLFMGSDVIKNHWPVIFEKILTYSD